MTHHNTTALSPRITRSYVLNWWTLASGKLVQIDKLWHCAESGRVMATVRYIVNDDGALASTSFEMALSNITRYGQRVAR